MREKAHDDKNLFLPSLVEGPGPRPMSVNRKETDLYEPKSAHHCEGKHSGANTSSVYVRFNLNKLWSLTHYIPFGLKLQSRVIVVFSGSYANK